MLYRGQVDDKTFEVLRTTANILEGYDLTSPIARACFEKAEAAVRMSKLLIERSDTLIEQLNRDLVQSAASNASTPDECAVCAGEDRKDDRAEKIP
jgi:hypothetical protein